MPKNTGVAAKSSVRKAKPSSQTKKDISSNSTVTVTSHVSKMSPKLKAEFRKLWDSSIQKAKTKQVIRDGAMVITIYK